jgi:hypothetical protein
MMHDVSETRLTSRLPWRYVYLPATLHQYRKVDIVDLPAQLRCLEICESSFVMELMALPTHTVMCVHAFAPEIRS